MPLAHAAHIRSVDADGVFVTRVPVAQVAHTLQVALFGVLLNEPLAQPAQVWSAIFVPAVATRVPAAQVVCAVQLAWLALVE